MSLTELPRQRKRRFLVPSVETLLSSVAPHLEERPRAEGEIVETIYFNTEKLSLPFGTCVRATHRLPDLAADVADGFYIFHEPKKKRSAAHGAPRKVKLSEIPEIAKMEQGLDGLRPYFAVRYRRARYAVKDSQLRLTIDTDVQYHSLLEGRVLVGQEAHPRFKLNKVKAAGAERDAFEAALRLVRTLPVTSKQWMGYSTMEEYYRLPVRNEFPCYEYEAKLESDGSDIDPTGLPFEHLQSFQGQTIRRYYQGYRASFRADRATIVRRGEMKMMRGVTKRQETKEKGLSAWDLDEPWAEMNRYKKFFTLRNPATDRVYSVAIDRCVAKSVLYQAEVEYNGVLDKAAQGQKQTPAGNAQDEAAVIADILLLRDTLIKHYGFQPTTLSKKRWLRKQTE
jgi:hypothetical protein